MRSVTKHYTNGEVTVVWQNALCQHSGICARGLIEVFNPKQSPWINIGAADTQRIIEQVKQCPSGALSYFMNSETDTNKKTE